MKNVINLSESLICQIEYSYDSPFTKEEYTKFNGLLPEQPSRHLFDTHEEFESALEDHKNICNKIIKENNYEKKSSTRYVISFFDIKNKISLTFNLKQRDFIVVQEEINKIVSAAPNISIDTVFDDLYN